MTTPLVVSPLHFRVSTFSDDFAERLRPADRAEEPSSPDVLRMLATQPLHSAFLDRGPEGILISGVSVYDRDARVLYEVAAERRGDHGTPVCTRYTIAPALQVDMRDVSLLAPAFLAQVAVAFWDAVDSGEHDPHALYRPDPDASLDEPSPALYRAALTRDATAGRRYPRPSLDWIARTYRDAERDPESKAPRHVIAASRGVSVQLADKWIAAAREAGALPAATRTQGARGGGRPRKTTKGNRR